MSAPRFKLGHWYATEFETAGGGGNVKVIVTEVCVRRRSLRRTESVPLLAAHPGPPVKGLFRYLWRNRQVLDLDPSED